MVFYTSSDLLSGMTRAARHLLTAILTAGAAAAECLVVEVRDPAGLAVAGATVRAGSQSGATDASGAVRLCELAPARLDLRVEASDFAPASVPVDVPGRRLVTLALLPRVEPPVVVTGTPEPRQLDEVDRSITVIPVDNALVPGSWLADLLKMDPSVDVRERGVDGTQADVHVRGGSFGQTLVLINGHRVNDPQSGHHNLDLPLPVEAVSRMEVLRGSGSTLYGSDAVGGAVNVITRRPETAELRLSGGLGDFGWNRESISGAFRRGFWSQHAALARDFSTGLRPGRDYRHTALATESYLDTDLGATNVLFAYNDRPFGADGFYGAFPSWEETGTRLLAASHAAGRQRARFSYRRHSDHYVLYRDRPEVFQNFHTAGTWNGAWSYHGAVSSKVDFTGGVEGLLERIDSTNLGRRRRGRVSAFVVLQARPSPRLTLTAGLREEAYRRWRAVTSPTLAAGFRLGKGFKARGSLGHAFRVPSYTDLYYRDPANRGNPDLRPESAWTYEAGLDWWGRRGTTATAAWFHRRERDTIDFVRPSGAAIWEALNFHRLRFHGGEFEVRQRFGAGDVGLAYALMRASRRLTPGVASRYVFNFPRNSLAATARLPLGRRLVARTRLGAFNRPWHSTRALWDFALAGEAGRLRPFVQVTNLLNTYHEAFPGLAQPGRWIRGGVEIRVLSGR
jgi:iron complex outermembrane receptor protein